MVGVKDERMGEQVCACIRLKNGQTSSPEEIKAFCKGQVRNCFRGRDRQRFETHTRTHTTMFNMFPLYQISHFKIPHYVMFVDSFPLTVSGKVRFLFPMNLQNVAAYIYQTKGTFFYFSRSRSMY